MVNDVGMKLCCGCGKHHSVAEFNKNKNKKDGLQSRCRRCRKDQYITHRNKILARISAYYQANIEKVKQANRDRRRSETGTIYQMFKRTLVTAREDDLPHNIDIEFVANGVRRGLCEATGWPLQVDAEPRSFYRPSVDQKVAGDGYIIGNARIVCWGVNNMLGNYGEDKLIEVADAIRRKRNEQAVAA